MKDTIAQRKARAIEKLTNDRDEAIKRAEAAEARAAQLKAERDTAWTELRVIRKTIGADDNEATSDEVSRLFGKLTTERDEAQSELQHIRTMLDDGTAEGATALDMVKKLHQRCYAAERDAWSARM